MASDLHGAQPAATETYHRSSAQESGDAGLVPADSDTAPVVSVILPTLNEESGIAECIERVKVALSELDIPGEIIVSDSSTDQTPDIARDLGARVIFPDQRGYGYAYRYAFEYAHGEYIVLGDADTTYDFCELPKLYRRLEDGNADLVLGSRFTGNIHSGAMPALHRYIGNPALTRFLNLFYDAGVSDAHTGFRIIRRDALEALPLRATGMEFASEMVMAAAAQNLVIDEVPIEYHPRVGEETLNSFTDGWRHVKFMVLNAPGFVFSFPGFGFSILGLLVMAASLAGFEFAAMVFGTHTMIAGSLFAIMGYQLVSLGVFSSIATDPIRRPTDVATDWIRTTVTFEHGVLVGGALFAVGAGFLGVVGVRWLLSGRVGFSYIVWNMFALTLAILGLQTVFSSVFLSMIGVERSQPTGSAIEDRPPIHRDHPLEK